MQAQQPLQSLRLSWQDEPRGYAVATHLPTGLCQRQQGAPQICCMLMRETAPGNLVQASTFGVRAASRSFRACSQGGGLLGRWQ